ncbi:MAG TPA: hypothetical protein VMD74_00800, partial [Candidatus Methylomirabilis sp.]|nr:hypothetical protein [Candidatus Methylomirabilis sp.]
AIILWSAAAMAAGNYSWFKSAGGDRYTVSSWSCQPDSVGHGDSSFVAINKVTENSGNFVVDAAVQIQANWFLICIQGDILITATLTKGPPARVYDCSSKFKNCLWLDTISFKLVWKMDTTFGHIGTESGKVTFNFPILPPTEKYQTDDYFRAKTSDSTWYYFNFVASDSCFYGFNCNSHRNAAGQTIRIFPYLKTRPDHPLRLKYADVLVDTSVYRFSPPGETIKYLNYDLTRLRTGISSKDNYFCLMVDNYIPAPAMIWLLNNPGKVRPDFAKMIGLYRIDLLGRTRCLSGGAAAITVIKNYWWDTRKNLSLVKR